MVKAVVQRYGLKSCYDINSSLLSEIKMEASNLNELFKKFYLEEIRPLRYCNGWYAKFKDSRLQHEYEKWDAMGGVTFEMFYGNATVD